MQPTPTVRRRVIWAARFLAAWYICLFVGVPAITVAYGSPIIEAWHFLLRPSVVGLIWLFAPFVFMWLCVFHDYIDRLQVRRPPLA